MKYYKEQQRLRKQQKQEQMQQQRFLQAQQNMKLYQINCRALHHCKNGQTQLCFRCKHNKACAKPQGDYWKPKIPGIRFL